MLIADGYFIIFRLLPFFGRTYPGSAYICRTFWYL